MAKRAPKIVLPEDQYCVQSSLFRETVPRFGASFPCVYRSHDNFIALLLRAKQSSETLGVDFEFGKNYKASIVGIGCSKLNEAAAVYCDTEFLKKVFSILGRRKIKLVGHSVIGAEIEVLKKTIGLEMGIDEWEDTLLTHYLLNGDLQKAPDKSEEEAGAMGFMDLWSATSLVVDWPNWKFCRGLDCSEDLCPKHDVLGYCAIDAFSSDRIYAHHISELGRWGVPEVFYNDLKELTWIGEKMQRQGVKVDMPWVRKIEAKSDEYKESLFGEDASFNPRSSEQVLDWFNSNGIKLASNDKKEITRVLEKTAERYGFSLKDEKGKFSTDALSSSGGLPQGLDYLFKLYEFKGAGKGLDAWFSEKYRDKEDFIHPRWITYGASTGRWSSARPNCTNRPTRGFGVLVNGAIIPRSPNLDLLHADASNLELRCVCYLAGLDTSVLGKDAFAWLVEKSGGGFEKAASLYGGTARDIAKSMSHAGNYMEGIKILAPVELEDTRIKKEIEEGALRVYHPKYSPHVKKTWEYCGGIVAFTGANLAERIFGSRTRANRKKALEIQEDIYFKNFPFIREWQQKTLDGIQDKHYVQLPTGNFLRLYGTPLENAKVGVAFLGQGMGAAHMGGIILRFHRELGQIPLMFVHDALDFEIPRGWCNQKAYEFISLMGEETSRFPGFKAPFKAKRGRCGLEYDEKNPMTHVEGAMKPLII